MLLYARYSLVVIKRNRRICADECVIMHLPSFAALAISARNNDSTQTKMMRYRKTSSDTSILNNLPAELKILILVLNMVCVQFY